MANEKKATGADADKRKKITVVLIVVVIGFLLWQVSDMLGGSSSTTAPIETPQTNMAGNTPAGPGGATPNQQEQSSVPQVARPLPMSQRESELLKLQQQTQLKYVETMNELQMLKLSLEIAETNKNIMAAKLATIKDQKDIVDMLAPPKKSIVTDYSQTLSRQQPATVSNLPSLPQTVIPTETQDASGEAPAPMPVAQMAAQTQPSHDQREEPEIPYTVVSVSKIQDRWSAVIGVQGALFSIHIGDIIPADGSKVTQISSRGIVLERKGKERKVSLVPII